MRKRVSLTTRAKERANISFFIFVMFFAVFGLIVLTELLMLERASSGTRSLRARLVDDIQVWPDSGRTESSGIGAVTPSLSPAREPLDAHWQPVSGSKFKFFVYSAYIERRTIPSVRIIAATRTRGARPVWCQIYLANNRTVTVLAIVKPIREHWNLKYSACFVLCPLRNTETSVDDLIGARVSVVSSKTSDPSNMLKVLDTKPEKGVDDKVHICVKPFHYSYSRALWLLEWMELHLLLGVSHFIMYNESLSSSVQCLLDHYQKKNLLTMLPWKLDIVSDIEIRNHGQFAAFNDCLYRSMVTAGWLAVLDVDEVIFPKHQKTLPMMLSMLRSARPMRPPAALLFRNAFFYTRWENDAVSGGSPLLTQQKTKRWAIPHAVKNRSKYVVKPVETVELGNHFVWEFAPGGTAYGVPPDRALLHHYRMECEFGGKECLTVASVTDRTAHGYAEELEQNVYRTHRSLHNECALQPLYTPTTPLVVEVTQMPP